MDLDDFKLDDDLSTGGRWVPIGKNAELKIARLNNEKYREFVKKKLKPYKSAMRAGNLDEQVVTDVAIAAMARHVLLDWKGLTQKGEQITYSVEKAEEILTAQEQFREFVANLASDQDLFKTEELEEAAKN